ncbi:phage head-tail connector protein [Cytobacillus horneckiae]|uniref:phage head-tail connector protein n=1 Tax=Cytobacillus horneckiae TaxID=549687 RepID=UPI003D9A5DF4
MDKEEVKKILQIKTTKHDEYFETMIPLLIDWVATHCNNSFKDKLGQLALSGGVKIFIAKACEHNMNVSGVSSRSMGSVSYTYDMDFPPAIMNLLKPYKRVKFHASR